MRTFARSYSWLLLLTCLCFWAEGVLAQEKPKPVYYFNPDWSPDGSRVLFESNRDGRFALYTIRLDGSGLQKLTSGAADDAQARWSRDGKQIVFISNRDGRDQLYLMNACLRCQEWNGAAVN